MTDSAASGPRQAAASRAPAVHRLGPPQPIAAGALSAPPEIVAVIATAVEQAWPRSRPQSPATERGGPEYVWRMSGRWWSKPVPLRRDRPWSDNREHGVVDRP